MLIQGTSIGASTNLDGIFVISSLKPGEYLLNITYIGYKDKNQKVTVPSDKTVQIIVKMEWAAVKGEVIKVTAQASGQMAAINRQLSANSIKNVVSKDRIRQLPDNNAAESVGRLPGVSLLRSGGEGNQVVIRGLQPKYSKVMVDGVTLTPTNGNNRSVSMGMISSYSLEGIEVIKSPTADMDGDQIGGSVNFVMKVAPEGFNYDVVAQGAYNGLRQTYSDYLIVGGISNRFINNKLGVFAQVTADRKNMGSNSMDAAYTRMGDDVDKLNPLELSGLSLGNIFRDRNRIGGTITLDYTLPDGKVYLKNFLSGGESSSHNYSEYFGTASHSFTTGDSKFNQLIYSNILGYDQNFSLFKISAKISNSYSKSEVPKSLTFNFKYGHDMNNFFQNPNVKPQDIPSFAKNEYDKFEWSGYNEGRSVTDGRQVMARLDFEVPVGITNQINGKVQFGGKFRYGYHGYSYDEFGGFPPVASGKDYKNALIDGIPRFNGLSPDGTFYYPSFYVTDFDHGNFLNGEYELGPVADIGLLYDIMRILHSTHDHDGIPYTEFFHHFEKSSVFNNYTGYERLGAGYFMLNLDITKKIKFIPGIRYESMNTNYNGIVGEDGPFPETHYVHHDTTATRNNSFLLPMIHLRYELFDWMQIRFAYTHTLARPNYNYIVPKMNIGQEYLTVGNPNLKPELSKNYDLYFAFKENHLGLFTIGGFIKNIEGKIFNGGMKVLLNPEKYNLNERYKGLKYESQENNEDISVVKGIEIDWQTNFWYLPSVFKGLVFNINYTKIFSETKYPLTEIVSQRNPNPPPRRILVNIDKSYLDRLQNQPDHILNLSLGYDYKGFSARVSVNYSSDIFISSNFYKEERRLTDDFTRWDAQITQKLPWEGLSLYCNLMNINDGIERSHLFGWDKPRSMYDYGRAIYFGLRWKTN